jgi:hypothetical protein
MGAHLREVLYHPKSWQRVRVKGSVGTSTGANPRNYQDKYGSYYEVYIHDGDVWARRSYYASPPFAWEIQVTTSGDATYPWMYLLPWRRAVLLYTKAGTDTWVTYSDSEGESWEVPVLSIAGGIKAYGAVSPFDGTEIIAAFISATGKIGMRRRYAGAASYEAQVNIKDDGGVDLLFEDDTFSFWQGYEGPARWMLHAHIDGESDTSTWWSADECETFTRVV